MFTVGMTGSSLQFATLNTTTIENLSRKTIVWTLALYMPRFPETPPGFRTISYAAKQRKQGSDATVDQAAGTVRTFAILHTKPGENPFDLGPHQNFKSVMGDRWYDWLLPFKYSPCCDHDRYDSQFAMGPVVQRMRREAGIELPEEVDEEEIHRRRRRRRRRHQSEAAGAGGPGLGAQDARNEKVMSNSGYDGDEVDLESGLAHTNGTVH